MYTNVYAIDDMPPITCYELCAHSDACTRVCNRERTPRNGDTYSVEELVERLGCADCIEWDEDENMALRRACNRLIDTLEKAGVEPDEGLRTKLDRLGFRKARK